MTPVAMPSSTERAVAVGVLNLSWACYEHADDDAFDAQLLVGGAHPPADPCTPGARDDEVADTGFGRGAHRKPVSHARGAGAERLFMDDDEALGPRVEALGEDAGHVAGSARHAHERVVFGALRQVDERHLVGLDKSQAAGLFSSNLQIFFADQSVDVDRDGVGCPIAEVGCNFGSRWWVSSDPQALSNAIVDCPLRGRERDAAFVSHCSFWSSSSGHLVSLLSCHCTAVTMSSRGSASPTRISVARPSHEDDRPHGHPLPSGPVGPIGLRVNLPSLRWRSEVMR